MVWHTEKTVVDIGEKYVVEPTWWMARRNGPKFYLWKSNTEGTNPPTAFIQKRQSRLIHRIRIIFLCLSKLAFELTCGFLILKLDGVWNTPNFCHQLHSHEKKISLNDFLMANWWVSTLIFPRSPIHFGTIRNYTIF